MSDLGNDIVKKQPGLEDRVFTTTSSKPTAVEEDADSKANASKRRGVWKRIRIRPVDGFETAESQNIGSQIYNSVVSIDSKEQNQQQKDAKKGFGTYHSYTIEDEEDSQDAAAEEELLSNEQITIKPDAVVSTVYSPGDVDLGTGAPIIEANATKVVVVTTEADTVSTTEFPEVSTNIYEHEKEVDEIKISTTSTTLTPLLDTSTVTETTEPWTTFIPYESDDRMDQDLEEAETEVPFVNTERSYYEDYDLTEFKTESERFAKDSNSEDTQKDAGGASSNSIIDEVKQKLTELFSFGDDYDYHENSLKPKLQRYTTIERARLPKADDVLEKLKNEEYTQSNANDTEESSTASSSSTVSNEPVPVTKAPQSSFHRKLMDSVIYATSTSTEISHETEICYRGRCIKTDQKK